MMSIDEIDRKILRELQRTADMSMEGLSDKVGLSRNACWRRVKTLESNGIIRARVTLLDPEKLNLGLMVFLHIRTDHHTTDWQHAFAKATRDMPEILGVYRMTGDLDYMIRARVADMKDYDALYQRLIARVPMSDVSASFVMEEIKDTTELPL